MTKKFDLEAYKKSINLTELEEKEPKYVILNEELQACLGLPGFPLGDITEIYGDSDTGKSTLMLHAAAQAQAQNILVVCIIVEKKYREDRARAMGFNPDNALVNLSCKSVEDCFEFVDKIISDVNKGKLPYDTMIFIDSLGMVNCRASRSENKDGTTTLKNVHQQNAKAITEHLMVTSDKIGDTRYTSHNHFVGLVIMNQIYVEPPKFPGAPSINRPRGGKKLKYVSSLQMETKKTKELKATVDGNQKAFGIISKIIVKKNHINSIKNTGDFVIVTDKIFANEKGAIDDYKAENREEWGTSTIVESQPGEIL
jgi:recombination protein RecA